MEDRWVESFENFYTDMGKRPSEKHTIERLDVNGNYEPRNCVWIDDRTEQAFNQTLKKSNTSGKTGVCFNKSKNKWEANIGFKGEIIYLGAFTSKDSAISARKVAELIYYGYTKE